LSDPDHLTPGTVDHIASPDHLVAVSAVSVWEVVIERARGRLRFDGDPVAAVVDNGFEPLPISPAHAARAGDLPAHPCDPSDRMLVAQAALEGLTIVTRDPAFAAYDVPLLAA
jgi:PIN domain nuclease of toxin-antitoxin system